VTEIYHYSHVLLAGLIPVAFVLSPSFLNYPVDLALGLAIPVHMHLGMVQVIEDYVPQPVQNLSILGMLVLSLLTGLGLLKINLCGFGITESFKSLWRAPPEQKKIKAPKEKEGKKADKKHH